MDYGRRVRTLTIKEADNFYPMSSEALLSIALQRPEFCITPNLRGLSFIWADSHDNTQGTHIQWPADTLLDIGFLVFHENVTDLALCFPDSDRLMATDSKIQAAIYRKAKGVQRLSIEISSDMNGRQFNDLLFMGLVVNIQTAMQLFRSPMTIYVQSACVGPAC